MDVYQTLDLPNLSHLSPKQQREIMTNRYAQIMDRTYDAVERKRISDIFQNAMDATLENRVDGTMTDWVKAGEQFVQEQPLFLQTQTGLGEFAKIVEQRRNNNTVLPDEIDKELDKELHTMEFSIHTLDEARVKKQDNPKIENSALSQAKTENGPKLEPQVQKGLENDIVVYKDPTLYQLIQNAPVQSLKQNQVFSGALSVPQPIEDNKGSKQNIVERFEQEDEEDLLLLPCPFGHQHRYEKDVFKPTLLLRCPSCKTMFSVLASVKCISLQKHQSLSFREQEWVVDYAKAQKCYFRGSYKIELDQGDYFSLISFGASKEDFPLWLINHSKDQATWALSGQGVASNSVESITTPATQLQIVLWGYLVPFIFLFLLGLAFFNPILSVVIAALLVMFLWRPFFVPVIFPSLGEFSIYGRYKVFSKKRKGEF